MNISNMFTILLLALLLVSCNNEDKKTGSSNKSESLKEATHNLAGHVYYFGPALDSTNCSVVAECDCCTDDFLFLNEKDFIRIAYCMAEQSVIKGTYSIEKNNVILKYDSLSFFTELDENYDIETVGNVNEKKLIKTETNIVYLDTISQFNCNNKIFYKSLSEISFGTNREKDSIQPYVDKLKKDGFWKKLNPKNN